jgi:3-hydroxyisobutyrate dehydrogenase-like beta-hydroxyacid dehydrogenase
MWASHTIQVFVALAADRDALIRRTCMSTNSTVGFIGLGNIGGPIAANVSAGGFPLLAYDAAGTAARLPKGAVAANSCAQVAAESTILFMSLPNAQAVGSVVSEITGAARGSLKVVVDLSTIGVRAATKAAEALSKVSVSYLDSPVSGGVDGAKKRKIAVMCAGSRQAFDQAQPYLDAISERPFYVGHRPGQGQALKLLNNFLSATALAATSEAVIFGLRNGLAMESILEVVNASSGRSMATVDKFPNHVVTGKFASGFHNTLMNKDVSLYLNEATLAHCDGPMGALVADIWRRFSEDMPACDFTLIYQFVNQEIESSRKH